MQSYRRIAWGLFLYVFQSPIAYYSGLQRWAMAPGFENSDAPDFNRPVTAACLWCHSNRPFPRKDTLNQFEGDVFDEPISANDVMGPVNATSRIRRRVRS